MVHLFDMYGKYFAGLGLSLFGVGWRLEQAARLCVLLKMDARGGVGHSGVVCRR